jgi:phage baseplate assembly protein W
MAIKVKSLKKLSDQYAVQKHVYKDLTLDMDLDKIIKPGCKVAVPGKDIKVSLDTKAISNSLLNLFNTRPGQRFLFPEYGVDLLKYVFVQINDTNGDAIGNAILAGIEKFEPRINVIQIRVNAIPDENTYNIDVYYRIIILNQTVNSSFSIDTKEQNFISLSTDIIT